MSMLGTHACDQVLSDVLMRMQATCDSASLHRFQAYTTGQLYEDGNAFKEMFDAALEKENDDKFEKQIEQRDRWIEFAKAKVGTNLTCCASFMVHGCSGITSRVLSKNRPQRRFWAAAERFSLSANLALSSPTTFAGHRAPLRCRPAPLHGIVDVLSPLLRVARLMCALLPCEIEVFMARALIVPCLIALGSMPMQFFPLRSTQEKKLLLGKIAADPDDIETLKETCNARK